MTVPSFNIPPGQSTAATAERRKIAMLLMKDGMDTSPVRHWSQGLARVAQAMMGGYELRKLDQEEKDRAKAITDIAQQHPALQGSTSAPTGLQRIAAAVSKAPINPAAITSPQSAGAEQGWTPDERGVLTNENPNAQSPLDPVPGAITPDRARLLAAIQPGESGGQYDVMYGGGKMNSYADHPRVANPIMSGPNAGKTSSAAGAYQFIAPTWDRAKNALNLPDFSPPNQNAAAAYTAGNDYEARTGMSLDRALVEAGNDPAKLAAIGKTLSPTWTSLPGGIEQGQSGQQFAQNMGGATDVSAQSRQPAAQPLQPGVGIGRDVPQIPPQIATQIRAALAHPNQAVKQYGLQLLQAYGAPKEQPNEVREYEYGLRNPDFARRQIELKQASRPQVTVDQRGETEFVKESGKLAAKKYSDLAEDAMGARQMISDLEMLRTLGAQIGTGKAAQTMAALGPYAQTLGIEMKGLDEAQAYEAIVQRVAPNLRVKGSGAQSDFELRNFLKSMPSIGNTPGGNEIASRVLEGLYQNKIAAAEIGSRALNGEITRSEAEKQLRELPDPMAGYREFIKKTKPEAAKEIKSLRNKYGLE